MVIARRGTMARLAAFALAAALTCVALVASARSASADNYPGLDDIAAAKAAVANQRATVAELDAVIVQLAQAAEAAQVEAQLAADRYVEAREVADKARAAADAAAREAARAAADLDRARAELAAVAQATYRNGGSLTQLEAIVGANGFEEVIGRTEDFSRAAAETDAVVQRVKAAKVVADTTADLAAEAAAEAEGAADEAQVALTAAQEAERIAQQAVADAEATRTEAVAQLAALQRTTVALQEQRQAGLAAERAQREREAYEQALAEAEAAAASGGGTATTPPPSGGGTATTPPPSSGGGTTTPPASSGSWKSTDAQGSGAAAYAQTLMGLSYQLGGNGPAYDCSGITYASWKSQGVTLPRSSKTQYFGTTHVPLSQMRPGDLVFYGTGRDPNAIYHVALYIGSGLVAEATSPGNVSQIRAYDASWRINNLIPYAGRP